MYDDDIGTSSQTFGHAREHLLRPQGSSASNGGGSCKDLRTFLMMAPAPMRAFGQEHDHTRTGGRISAKKQRQLRRRMCWAQNQHHVVHRPSHQCTGHAFEEDLLGFDTFIFIDLRRNYLR